MNKIECVIFDWAGTTVDYGCFAPVNAFVKAFEDLGITITVAQARGPMGMTKIEHIKELFKLPSVTQKFTELKVRDWNQEDVEAMNADFEKYLFASLSEFTDVIDGVLECVATLRESGLKIGSTTGYTSAMMDIVSAGAKSNGYAPDCYVTSDNLPGGRPRPFMIYQNMINLAVDSPKSIVKVGDTISDVREGVNSGVWSVGVVLGSSEMGLTYSEAQDMDRELLEAKMTEVREKYFSVGAHYVINTIDELPELIDEINNQL
ncbi:MAG: phosphonoacetaldehyde hydrolase [Rikenellaceae bacterium]